LLKGTAEIELDNHKVVLKEGENIKIDTGVKHRIKAIEDCVLLEISYGKFDENDITRIEDDYGRVN
jgi:quercetin dioxygenase-like cupin family protein